jgi:hypothetical protein
MSRLFLLALFVPPFASSAMAAPADWKSYLCKYGADAETRLVKVNEKDGRVLLNDRDAGAVKITSETVSFRPTGITGAGVWTIKRPSGDLEVLILPSNAPASVERGSCKVVDE